MDMRYYILYQGQLGQNDNLFLYISNPHDIATYCGTTQLNLSNNKFIFNLKTIRKVFLKRYLFYNIFPQASNFQIKIND